MPSREKWNYLKPEKTKTVKITDILFLRYQSKEKATKWLSDKRKSERAVILYSNIRFKSNIHGFVLITVFDKVHTLSAHYDRVSRVNLKRGVHLSKREVYPDKAQPWKDFVLFCAFNSFVFFKDC